MRCNNEELLSKINSPKLNKQTEATFTVMKDLPNCRRIKTRDQLGTVAGSYNKWNVPRNAFECLGEGCVNSGTFTLTAAGSLDYFGRFNAKEIAAGAVTFYVYKANATPPVSVTVSLSDTQAHTNADTYTVSLAAGDFDEAGFAPVIVDLSQAGTEVGDGWEASEKGVYLKITVDKVVGLSSISFFESIDDFATLTVVKVGCLSTAGGTLDVSLIESACAKATLNDQMTGLTYNLTGRNVTANYRALSPLMSKGKKTEGFEIVTEEYTVGNDATVTIADLYQRECRFIAVQRKGACNETDAGFTQLTIPNSTIVLSPDHFQVLPQTDGSTTVRFAEELKGFPVLISYPRQVEVDETVVSTKDMNSVHTSMAIPVCVSDRVKEMHVFNNVFVTSFPAQISESDSDFSFSINIQPDKGGDFYHIYRIVE